MRFIEELEGLVSSQVGVIKTCLSLTKLEARLAGLSLFPLLVNLCMLLVCLTLVWLTAMSMLTYVLMQALDNVLLALACVFLFNIVLVGLLCKYLLFNLKNMSFEKTRAYLSGSREAKVDELKNTGDDGNSSYGKKTMEARDAGE